MTKKEVAEALGAARHIIPPLSRVGLIKPLGHPPKYCMKHYSCDLLAMNLAGMGWLDKVVAAIHKHWRDKNVRKRAKLAKLTGSQITHLQKYLKCQSPQTKTIEIRVNMCLGVPLKGH